MKTISVIIPVYNTPPKLIRNCLDSVMSQMTTNHELIIVNDSSTQKDTIDFLESVDTRKISLVNHKENKGLGPSRNTGLDLAKGKYVLFLDSDDWLSSSTLEKLDSLIAHSHYDFINFNFTWIYENEELANTDFLFKYKKKIIYGRAVSWSKIYNRKFLSQNNIRFENSSQPHEDEFFFFIVLLRTTSFFTANDNLYFYNKQNENSIMSVVKIQDSMEALAYYLTRFYDLYKTNEWSNFLQKYLKSLYYKPLQTLFRSKGGITWEIFKRYAAVYQRLNSKLKGIWLLKYFYSPFILRIVFIILKTLSFKPKSN